MVIIAIDPLHKGIAGASGNHSGNGILAAVHNRGGGRDVVGIGNAVSSRIGDGMRSHDILLPHGGEHQIAAGFISGDATSDIVAISIFPAHKGIVLPDGGNSGQGIFLILLNGHSRVGIIRIGGIKIKGQVDGGNVDRVALDVEGAKELNLFGCVRAGTRNAGFQREVAGAGQLHMDAFHQQLAAIDPGGRKPNTSIRLLGVAIFIRSTN